MAEGKRGAPKGNQNAKGHGRPSRSDEQQLIERLDKVINQDEVIAILMKLILKGDMRAIQLYMNYRHGKPKETVSASHTFNDFSISDVLRFKK